MIRSRWLASALLLASVAIASPARADRPEDKAAAQVLFEAGRQLVQQKKFAEACPKFAESLRLDRGIGTMLWLADCYENNNQTASAWAQFKEAASVAALQNDTREQVARRRATTLEARLSKLSLVPPGDGTVPGLEVRRDGVRVSVAELGLPVPVDPGIHTIDASAPGRRAWSSRVEVPAHEGVLAVTIPVLEVQPGDATGVTPPGSQGATDGEHPPAISASTRRILGIAAAGAGVVTIGIGTYLGVNAKSSYDAAAVQCPNNHCNGAGYNARTSAYHEADASTALFIVGPALIAGGAVLYFTAPRLPANVDITPAVGPHAAFLSLRRSW